MRICPFSCSATNGRHRSRLGSRQARCLDLDPIAALAQTSTGHRGACSSTLPSSVARSWKGSERETAQQPKRSRRPAREHRTQGTHLPRTRWCRPWHQQRQLHIRFAARQSFKKFQAGVCANLSSLAADIAIVRKRGTAPAAALAQSGARGELWCPIAPSTRHATFHVLSFEIARCLRKHRPVDIVECIDVHDRISSAIDHTRHDRNNSTRSTHVEIGRLCSESVLARLGRVGN
jgi:hypothetical protein